uniref:Glucose-induced degradation protein 8-like protein n=1 Tax=Noccaea caerulescens TaxID=107243 RepID=A0A1J3E0L1_NOCCA
MFAFDIKKYEASERKKQQMEFEKIIIHQWQSHRLVRNYLLHYGYEETLKAFNLATETSVPRNAIEEQDVSFALQDRKNLRELIMKGEIDAAIAKLRDSYPQLLQNDKSELCFLLHCQKFIELVRIGEIEEARKYGRVELAKFTGVNVLTDIVQDCFALVAYTNPEESVVAYFLGETQKEVVADAVNAMVLSTNENIIEYEYESLSRLERLLRQLSTCSLLLRTLYNRQGEVFSLHQFLNNNF